MGLGSAKNALMSERIKLIMTIYFIFISSQAYYDWRHIQRQKQKAYIMSQVSTEFGNVLNTVANLMSAYARLKRASHS